MASQNTLELQRFFASIMDVGVGHLRKQEMLFLMGRKRLTTSIWVDLYELWREVGDQTPLLVGEAEGAWAFAYGQGLRTTKESWFQDIRKKAELTIE